jgi:hypothetical protein
MVSRVHRLAQKPGVQLSPTGLPRIAFAIGRQIVGCSTLADTAGPTTRSVSVAPAEVMLG